jgi:phosphoglycerol transferase MdoB-like AlkP superfamily enzyme
MLIYSPAHIKPQEVDNIVSQIDVAPTLLGLMDFSYDSLFIGEDVLAEGANVNRAFIANYQHLGLFQNNQLVYMKPKKLLVKDAKPFEGGGEVELEINDDNARQLISWYQAAERIEQNKMSRVEANNFIVELSQK